MKRPNLKQIVLYADNCFGQNKNRTVLSLLIWASNQFKVDISLKFFVKGHTMNDSDSVRGLIERRRKNHTFFDSNEYVNLIKMAKVEQPFYNVIEMKHSDFVDFGMLLQSFYFDKNDNGDTFFSSTMKTTSFSNNFSGKMIHRDSWFSPDHKEMTCYMPANRRGRKRKNFVDITDFSPPTAYSAPFPISTLKYIDLKSLCEKNLIPEKYHQFYITLPHKIIQGDQFLNDTDLE